MSFSLVQSAKFVTGGGSPESCSFTNPVGNGNMVVVIVGQYNATGDTLTDNKSNTYNLRFSHQAFASSYEFDVYDLLNVTNGPQTVTFTVSSGSGNPIAIFMAEFTPSGSFDQSNSTILTGATSSGAVTGGSVTPTANGELILGFAATTNTGMPALGDGFTTAVSDTGNDNAGLEAILGYQVQSTAAAITLTGSGFNQYSPVSGSTKARASGGLFARAYLSAFTATKASGSSRLIGQAYLRASMAAQAVSSAPLSVFAHFRALSATATGQAVGRAALSIAVQLVSNPNLLAVAVLRVAAAFGDTRLKPATAKQRATAATAFERIKTATASERSLVAVGRSNTMSQTNPLSPNIDATVEFETVTFDYGLILAAGATVTSATVTCSVVSATNATPSQRVVGSSSNTTSLQTGAPSAAVSQLVGGMVAGATYRLQCVAVTSDGQQLSLWTHLTCQAPS